MPELPEVETIKNGLVPVMQGQVFKSVHLNRKDLRFPFPDNFIKRLEAQRVERLLRRAKFLVAELSSGETLLMHLGMSGSFIVDGARARQNPKHDHVKFEMSGGGQVIYNDPRRFGFMELLAQDVLGRLVDLGPEPLSNSFNGVELSIRLKGKKTPIKNALLDQRIVAGLGNIYVCEALYESHISPLRPADSLRYKECDNLVSEIKAVLLRAIEAGGSTLNDYVGADGAMGYFQHSFKVYGRTGETCPNKNCQGEIVRIKQAGRSTFYCPYCQK